MNTGVIDQFLNTFTTYIDSGFGLLGGEVAFLATTLVPRHSDCDMLNPNITATLAGVSDRRGLRYCEGRPVAV